MSLIHWIVIAVVGFLFFRRGSMYEIGNGLGKGIRGLKEGLKGEDKNSQKPQQEAAHEARQMRDVTPSDDDDERGSL